MVEELLTVGRYHRSRKLPGVTRFGGAPVGPTVAGTANPKSRPQVHVLVLFKIVLGTVAFFKKTKKVVSCIIDGGGTTHDQHSR